MKRQICHRLALVAALAAGGCDGSPPVAPDLGPPVVHEEVAADVIELLAHGSTAVKVLVQDETVRVAAVPFRLDKVALASDEAHHVIPARAESAFEVHLPGLAAGSRLVARTFVYNAYFPDPAKADPPSRLDPAPVTFRILVNGVERAKLSSDYVTRPEGRKNPYDVMMRTLDVPLDGAPAGPLVLRFETTRPGPPAPEGAVPAEPVWWDLQVVQPVSVPRQAASRASPNVLLLVVDTLGARHTSLHGAARDTTPHLRELAARGLYFTRAVSPSSWTMPAMASLLTGLPPNTHGVLGGERSYLMAGLRTVAEVLREQGLETAAFSANVLLAPATGFDQGFGHFELSATDQQQGEGKEPAASMNARLLAWLDGQPRGARWFAWVQYMDPHAPYNAPGKARLKYAGDYVERRDFSHFMPNQVQSPATDFVPLAPDEKTHLADLYDAEVAYFDDQLGQLQDALRQRGLLENTLIVLTADHGEELFEHGQIGHGYSLYDELLHVPLVFAGASLPAGTRCDVPVSTAGLAATLLSVANASAPGIEPSLFPPPESAAGPIYSTARTELFGPRQVLVSAQDEIGRKVIYADEQGVPGSLRLFDRRTDPGEQQPLEPGAIGATERAAFDALLGQALEWAARTADACPPGPQPTSPAMDKAFQQLGYTGGGAQPKPKQEDKQKPAEEKKPDEEETVPR